MEPYYTADNIPITVGMTVYYWDQWDKFVRENQVSSIANNGTKVNFVNTSVSMGARVDIIYAKKENCPCGL